MFNEERSVWVRTQHRKSSEVYILSKFLLGKENQKVEIQYKIQ